VRETGLHGVACEGPFRPSEAVALRSATDRLDPAALQICPTSAREARESGLWLNGGLGPPTVLERIRASQSARSHSVRVPSAAARSAAPNIRRQLQRPAPSPFVSPDEPHPLRGSKASSRAPATKRATGFRTASQRNQRPSAVVEAGPADSRGTADGQSPARPTAIYGDAPCRSARCRSRNCNRRRNPHNLAGGAATVGVWGPGRGGGQKAGLVTAMSRPTRGWEQDRRGDEVQSAVLTPWPKKRSNFASPRRHSP
jgi:hypothetical protein